VKKIFAATEVSWGPYQTFHQLLEQDPRCSTANPLFETVEQPGLGPLLTPASPLYFSGAGRVRALRAPKLGEHTNEILAELGLSDGEIASLHDRKIVAGVEG
jgi:2-methylfumaryl-CoA isomerase